MSEYSTFLKVVELLEPHYYIVLRNIQPFIGRVFHLCRYTVVLFYCPNRLGDRTLVGGVFHLCRYTVVLFYCPNRLGDRTLVGGFFHLCGYTVVLFYCPNRLGDRTLVGGVLLLCRHAVGVFYSSDRLCERKLVGGVLVFSRDAVDVFYGPRRQGHVDQSSKPCWCCVYFQMRSSLWKGTNPTPRTQLCVSKWHSWVLYAL